MNELVKVLAKVAGVILIAVKYVALFVLRGIRFIWVKYCEACGRHNFKPKRLLCTITAVAIVLCGVAVASEMIERYNAENSSLGLANIGELVTQAYHYRSVDTLEKSQKLWGWEVPLTEAQSIFSYEGIVKAGYNFEDIEVDVNYTEKEITVNLPEPQILSNEIIEDSLHVYSEDTNIFTPMKVSDFNKKQIEMKTSGEEDAIKIGIYDAARSNVEVLIKGFLSGAFDFDEYTLIFE